MTWSKAPELHSEWRNLWWDCFAHYKADVMMFPASNLGSHFRGFSIDREVPRIYNRGKSLGQFRQSRKTLEHAGSKMLIYRVRITIRRKGKGCFLLPVWHTYFKYLLLDWLKKSNAMGCLFTFWPSELWLLWLWVFLISWVPDYMINGNNAWIKN